MTTKSKQAPPPETPAPITMSSTEVERLFAAPATSALSPPTVGNGKTNLAEALAKAQAECQNVTMNKVNPHFRSKYADLSAVRDAIVPVFNRHGISIIQAPNTDGLSGFSLETRLIHASGEELVFNFPLPSDVSKMQAVGSAISYARRYTLSAIAGIASEEDDDGNAATTNTNGRGQSSGGYGAGGKPQNGGGSSSSDGGISL